VQFYLKETVFLHNFAPDLPARTAEQLWATQRPAATAAFDTPSAAAAWKTIPSWYVIGMREQIITPESDLAMAHRAHSHIVQVPGGSHLTLISHPSRSLTRSSPPPDPSTDHTPPAQAERRQDH
jgi:pimeloyl-ACP methyl ester carboxylesterase